MNAAVYQLPAQRARVANYTGSETCRRCLDDARIVVSVRREPVYRYTRKGSVVSCWTLADAREQAGWAETEEMGPCPLCERGFRLEFGIGRNKDGSEYENPRGGPWGRDGYWRGREAPSDVETATPVPRGSHFQTPPSLAARSMPA